MDTLSKLDKLSLQLRSNERKEKLSSFHNKAREGFELNKKIDNEL